MTEKWTKARCKRILEDPENWDTDFFQGYISEESFEFYSVEFVRFKLNKANSEWEMIRRSYMPIAMLGTRWEPTRHLYIVMKDKEEGQEVRGLAEINQSIAIDMMMDAVKQEEHNPDE